MHRSFHFIPGHRKPLFDKLKLLDADHIIFDLEDGVASSQKEEARLTIYSFLSCLPQKNFWIRINNPSSQHFLKDVELLRLFPNIGIVVPKVDDLSALLSVSQESPVNKGQIIALVESFKGVENLSSFASSPLLFAVCLGIEDLFSCLAIPPHSLTELTNYIKIETLVCAKANGLICIDGVSINYDDDNALLQECKDTRNLGFDGKMSIHPNQLPIINNAFGVDEELVEWAMEIKRKSNLIDDFGYRIVG